MKWLNRTSQVAIVQNLLITWDVNYKTMALALWRDQHVLEEGHFILKVFLFFPKIQVLECLYYHCRQWESDTRISKIWEVTEQRGTKSTYPVSTNVKMEIIAPEIDISQEGRWDRIPPIPKMRASVVLSAMIGQIMLYWLITKLSSTLWMRLKTLILKFKELINKHFFRDWHSSQRVTRKHRWWEKGIIMAKELPNLTLKGLKIKIRKRIGKMAED